MTSQISGLRRKMVLARAQAALFDMACDFCSQWYLDRLEKRPLPRSQDFIIQVARAGFHLPSFVAVVRYLERCRESRNDPDPVMLLKTLLPWTVKMSSSL